MKTLLWMILPMALLAIGCGQSNQSGAEAAENGAVRAREPRSGAVDVAQLNNDLAMRAGFGTAEEVQALLKQGATTEAKNRYGLPVIFIAAQRGDTQILQALITAGALVNDQIGTTYNNDGLGYTGTSDGTPLGYAAAGGKVEAMQVLKQAGADVNGQGPAGATPLMKAAENGQLESVKWLLANGATGGHEKALGLAKFVANPDAKYQEIIRLLSKAMAQP